MIRDELARKSPGQLLMINLVRMCCQRGFTQLLIELELLLDRPWRGRSAH
jgi:hypothetical protein